MMLQHVGIRPIHPLTLVDFKKKIWEEEFPNGHVRRWNKRMLYSGCNELIDPDRAEILMECIYCPTCKEYFNTEQWKEIL